MRGTAPFILNMATHRHTIESAFTAAGDDVKLIEQCFATWNLYVHSRFDLGLVCFDDNDPDNVTDQ